MVRRARARGGATSYVAQGGGDGRAVALELVALPAGADVGAAAREAARAVVLEHAGTARTVEAFAWRGHVAVVRELVDGTDLDTLLRALERTGRRLEPRVVLAIGRAVADALASAHEAVGPEGEPAPVVHGGLAPARVLVEPTGRVRLSGFGVAAARGYALDPGDPARAFAAPEQLRGERVSARADAYALGRLLTVLLGGEREDDEPVASGLASVPTEVASAIRATQEPSAARRRVTCWELEEWLARGLDVEAAQRELGALVGEVASPSAALGSAPAARPAARARRHLERVLPAERSPGPGPLAPPRRRRAVVPAGPAAQPPAAQPAPAAAIAEPAERASWPAPAALVEEPPEPAAGEAPLGAAAPPSDAGAPPLSVLGSIGVAAAVAGAVIAIGVLVAERDLHPSVPVAGPSASASAPPALSAAAPASKHPSAPSSRANGPPKLAAPPTAATTATQMASASTAPPSAAPPSAAPPRTGVLSQPPDAAALPPTLGYLTVTSSAGGDVYVNGKPLGPANQALQTPCGTRYVRVGSRAPGGEVHWLTGGQTVELGCRTATTLALPALGAAP